MFELELGITLLLIGCILGACLFEFVNGFHDTANAVATVIYTNTLKPWVAVIWSGLWNFLGVMLGGIAVAIGIINLLPVEALGSHDLSLSISMILAILISAITWNVLTWYVGIPCSSSHTLIGSILGVGIAFSLLPGNQAIVINLGKAKDMSLSLLISPLVGFSLTVILMYLIKQLSRRSPMGHILFKEPDIKKSPPFIVRSVLVLTCTLVSFSHGSNDGQKGVGLMMLILIGFLPSYFALNPSIDIKKVKTALTHIELTLDRIDPSPLSLPNKEKLVSLKKTTKRLQEQFTDILNTTNREKIEYYPIRSSILSFNKKIDELIHHESINISPSDPIHKDLDQLRSLTDYAPGWVILMISFSLGIGTMVGWKRIVKTIGEKIGKEHLTYAQGGSAETVAAITIALSSRLGLPVSTTHVLSSGIAGSMVASKGIKNLQPTTIRNILIAWVITLPVVIFLSGFLFFCFRFLLTH